MPEPSHDYDNSLTGRFTKPEAEIEMLCALLHNVGHIFSFILLRWIRFKFQLRAFAKKRNTKR